MGVRVRITHGDPTSEPQLGGGRRSLESLLMMTVVERSRKFAKTKTPVLNGHFSRLMAVLCRKFALPRLGNYTPLLEVWWQWAK
jgi:hypothetical protein